MISNIYVTFIPMALVAITFILLAGRCKLVAFPEILVWRDKILISGDV